MDAEPESRRREAKILPEPNMIEDTKHDLLYVGVLEEIQRGRRCLDHGHKSSAVRHLREAWSMCHDYGAHVELRNACQDFEDELHHPHDVLHRETSTRRRAASMALEPSSASSTRLSRISSEGSLFDRLLTQLKQQNPPNPASTQDLFPECSPPLARVQYHSREGDSPLVSSTRPSSASFEGIEQFLGRLRKNQGVLTRMPKQERLADANTNKVEKVLGWLAHKLPQSPSAFKDSEEPSPRRHSSPVASPPTSPSTHVRHARKRSLHVESQLSDPVESTSPTHEALTPAACSSIEYSRDNYPRKISHDETSAALSDTPALTKLIEQIHTNPVVDKNSSMTGKIRRLSTDSLSISSLSIPTTTTETAEPAVPSPLRESFVADDEPLHPTDFTSASQALQQPMTSSAVENSTNVFDALNSTLENMTSLTNTAPMRTPRAETAAVPSTLTTKSPPLPSVSWNGRRRSTVSSDTFTLLSVSPSTSPVSDTSKAALRPQPLNFTQRPPIPSVAASCPTLPLSAAPTTTAEPERAENNSKSPELPAKPSIIRKHTSSTSPSSFPPRFPKPTPSGSGCIQISTPHRRVSASSSVISSLASKFQSSKQTHLIPERSSPSTQRAFSEGLARMQAAVSSKVGGIYNGKGSPSDPVNRSGSKDQPSSLSLSASPHQHLQQVTGSVSQRVLAINERAPSVFPSSSAASKTGTAKPWERARHRSGADDNSNSNNNKNSNNEKAIRNVGSVGSRTRNGTTASEGAGAGTVNDTTRLLQSSNARGVPARSASHPVSEFVRFGAEMGRGAGVRRD